MAKKRGRRQTGLGGFVANPLASRNKWAVRGRSIAYFLGSFLFVVSQFILHGILFCLSAFARFVVWLWHFKSQKESVNNQDDTSEPKSSPQNPVQVEDRSEPPARDDVREALISLGCKAKEAQWASSNAREKLGPNASDEDLVREALRVLPLFSGKKR